MDKKELEKKLKSDVKPGTESIAINEAQTQANQLLTEQSMNLESERQVANVNSVRDTELRGAIELGAQGSPNAQQVALPPQAAGLRPETQELLSRYGVNPQITESSRSNSNSTQSRSNSVSRQSTRTGDSKVTNTTNVTNITNNTTRNETKVDIDNPGIKGSLVPVPSPSQDNTGKFRVFLSNLFSKRDQEKRLQEREFRRREWSIKRMTDKVMDRMNKISDTFSKKMNPENMGRTFGSQIKLLLGMVGLTLLPKIWPKLVSGVDKVAEWVGEIKDVFNGTNGTFFQKLGNAVGTGIASLAGNLVGAVQGLGDVLSVKLGQIIGGKDYDKNSGKGVFQVVAEKLASFFADKKVSFDNDQWKGQFKDAFLGYLGQVKDDMKAILNEMVQERAEAVKEAASKINAWDAFKPAQAIGKLVDIIGAAVGGHKYLANAAMSDATKAANKDLQKGSKDEDFSSNGDIKTYNGARVLINNLSKASTDKDNSNSVTISEGVKRLYDYGVNGNGLEIIESDLDNIISRTASRKEDYDRIKRAISQGIENGVIQVVEGSVYNPDTKSGGRLLRIPSNAVPSFIGMISNIPGIPFDMNEYNFDRNNQLMSEFYKDKELYRNYQVQLDNSLISRMKGSIDYGKLFNPLHWGNEAAKFMYNNGGLGYFFGRTNYDMDFYRTPEEMSSLNQFGYYRYLEKATDYNDRFDALKDNLAKSTGVDRVGLPKLNMGSLIPDSRYGDAFRTGMTSARGNVSNFLLDLPSNAKRAWNTASSKASDAYHYVAYDANFDEGYSGSDSDNDIPSVIDPSKKSEYVRDKLKESDVVSYVVNWLMSNLGLSEIQAIGVAGVIKSESGFDPAAVNKMAVRNGDKYPDNGICQWQGKYRNEMFKSWVESKYGPQGNRTMPYQFDIDTQLEFLKYDLETNRPKTLDILRNSKSLNDAVDVFLRGYENGGNGLVSINKLNEAYIKQSKWWRDNTESTGQMPYTVMYADRVNNAANIYSHITGETPLVSESEYSSSTSSGGGLSSSGLNTSNLFSSESLIDTAGNLWGSLVSGIDSMFSGNDDTVNSSYASVLSGVDSIGIDESSSDATNNASISIAKATPPVNIEYDPVSKYIEDKEDNLANSESTPGLTNINTGGNTSVMNSGNTVVNNIIYNDSRNSYFDRKQRTNNR